MSKKVVIAGSANLQKEIRKWIDWWENKNFSVINFPEAIDKSNFISLYPKVHQKFFEDMSEADIVFIANEDKSGIEGYIGAETFAELTFAVAQNLVYNKNIEVILAKMPSEKVQSIDEIKLWLELGWIKINNE
ncbi:hypothetical protein C4544_00880 [candidate division WS5 bacterium]|uniref:Nucleoside 2-deoxyribosyltransferase n=1 Tax=candidate division WS5 bacterium TaxID=2093353 RepID=A0A419DFX6_9BACT|nr:MAG: hypothetical protein C4544_00880 [candidate division WS5 bacterium]